MQLQSLLSCRFSVNAAKNFYGSEAQMFVDCLDRVSEFCTPSPCAESPGNRFLHNHISMANTVSGVVFEASIEDLQDT